MIHRRPQSARKLLTSAARVATLVYVGAAETACNLQVTPSVKMPATVNMPATSCTSPRTVTAQPLSPNQLPSGLKLLLRADDLIALRDGDTVGEWPDASGNGSLAKYCARHPDPLPRGCETLARLELEDEKSEINPKIHSDHVL